MEDAEGIEQAGPGESRGIGKEKDDGYVANRKECKKRADPTQKWQRAWSIAHRVTRSVDFVDLPLRYLDRDIDADQV